MENSPYVGAVSLLEAGRLIGVSHSKIKELCRSNAIVSFRVGRRRLVSHDAIRDFIAKQEADR